MSLGLEQCDQWPERAHAFLESQEAAGEAPGGTLLRCLPGWRLNSVKPVTTVQSRPLGFSCTVPQVLPCHLLRVILPLLSLQPLPWSGEHKSR